MLALTALVSLSFSGTFSPAEQYERWAHFNWALDTIEGDALNQAAIATGSCWMLNKPFDSFYYWRRPAATATVLAALGSAGTPDTALGSPSNFTLTAGTKLASPCNGTGGGEVAAQNFTVAALAAATQNWYHALCAPRTDPSWAAHGYDPAYQPQQMALTASLLCLATCDVSNKTLPEASVGAVLSSPTIAVGAVCDAFQWGEGSPNHFATATSRDDLAQRTAPILQTPCGCGGLASGASGASFDARKLLMGLACMLLLLCIAFAAWQQTRSNAARSDKLLPRSAGAHEATSIQRQLEVDSSSGRAAPLVGAASNC